MVGDDLSAVSTGLGTRFIGRKIIYNHRLPSTMAVARREVRRGAAEGTVIIADEQTAGRGRIERRWLSPRGSISLSVILYPDIAHLPSLIMVASLAVVHCIRAVTGLQPQLKWPNDVLINGKKVCGILIESGVRGGAVEYAVIGIGINVNLRAAELSGFSATSLSDELGRNVSRLGLVRRLLVEIERLYLSLPGGDDVYREWRDSLLTLGRRVQARLGETEYQGTAESVDQDGSLLLRSPDGSRHRIPAGDVTLHD